MDGHPVRGRLNACILDALDGYMHAKYGALKARLATIFAPIRYQTAVI